jgi:hypothetical protein
MVAASGTSSIRAALATMTARPGCPARSARAPHRARTEPASSAAVGSSSSTSGRPEARAAASHTLRLEPVESMYIGLSMCGGREKPSTRACQRASSKCASPSRRVAVQARAVTWSKRSVAGSTKNTLRR